MTHTLALAHRGASAYAPENTMSAFELAIEMGSDGLEFDVQMTRDGIPVIIHDESLLRTTGVNRFVYELTWDELQQLDAGSFFDSRFKGEKIPLLEEVLQKFHPYYLNIELKNSKIPYEGLEEKVIQLVEKYCDPSNLIFSSFNHASVKKLKERSASWKTGLLYEEEPTDLISYAQEIGVSAVHPNFKLLTSDKVTSYQLAGLDVNTWTVNELLDIEEVLEMGVSAMISNYPDRLSILLKRRK